LFGGLRQKALDFAVSDRVTTLPCKILITYFPFLPRDASAECGYATVDRPSVCPSVCPSVRNV